MTQYQSRDKSHETKFVQQHLANERTFLAWVRTGIAIVGLGFLAAGVVFRSTPYTMFTNTLSAAVGIGSILLASLVFVFATRDYFKNRKAINQGSFHSSGGIMFLLFICMLLVNTFLLVIIAVLVFYT